MSAMLRELNTDSEEFAEPGRCQQIVAISVTDDASVTHEQDAPNCGDDVGDVVRDVQDRRALLRQ